MPKRIQLSRRKGWRKPEGAIVVARPSRWGNPVFFSDGRKLTADDRRYLVDAYRVWLFHHTDAPALEEVRAELAGHDLACWCGPDDPCHADVLLEMANRYV